MEALNEFSLYSLVDAEVCPAVSMLCCEGVEEVLISSYLLISSHE